MYAWFVLAVLLCFPFQGFAANTHGLPNEAYERGAWFGDALHAYAVSGCAPTVPSSSLAFGAFACKAYARGSVGELVYIDQAAATVTLANTNGVHWVAACRDTSTAIAGWTRRAGSHYVFQQAASQPTEPAGCLTFAKVTVAGSVITAVEDIALRLITQSFTRGTGTTGSTAPWIWETPGAIVTISAGGTLTLGACPQAGRWQIFNADGSSTGLVRFAAGACGTIYPEWWGADPTGVVDSTAIWADVIAAGADRAPIACDGQYLINTTAGNLAVAMIDGTQIIGTYRKGNPGPEEVSCHFIFDGGGSAIGTVEKGGSFNDLRLENVYIEDRDNDSEIGLWLVDPQSIVLDNVMIRNFATGALVDGNLWYGHLTQLKVDRNRTYGLEVRGAVNGGRIDVQVSGGAGIVPTAGVIVGQTGSFATSQGLQLRAVVEVFGGTPISIARVRNLDLEAYVEHPGNDADYSSQTSVIISRVRGGRINAFLQGDTGDAATITNGLYFASTAGVASDDVGSRNIIVTGHAKGYTTNGVVAEREEGMWGIDLSGFALDVNTEYSLGNFTTGRMVGLNYLTHGTGAPSIDEGRGCTKTECAGEWLVGDQIAITESGRLTNLVRTVTVAGNPPTTALLIYLTGSNVTAADGDATPTVKVGTTYVSRVLLASSATAITTFDDGQEGQTITCILEAGTRTITDGATIELGGSNFAMTAGDTLTLTLRGTIWYEVGRKDVP